MDGEISSLLDDQVYPDPVDDLPEPRQLRVDQVSQGDMFRSVSDLGGDESYILQTIAGQEHLLDMDTSGIFVLANGLVRKSKEISFGMSFKLVLWSWIGLKMATGSL